MSQQRHDAEVVFLDQYAGFGPGLVYGYILAEADWILEPANPHLAAEGNPRRWQLPMRRENWMPCMRDCGDPDCQEWCNVWVLAGESRTEAIANLMAGRFVGVACHVSECEMRLDREEDRAMTNLADSPLGLTLPPTEGPGYEPLIYLASPLSHAEPEVMRTRIASVQQFAGELIAAGRAVFCPVVYTAGMQETCPQLRGQSFNPDGLEWYRFDLHFLRRCDCLLALRLSGWQNSAGMALEIKRAEELGLPVYYADWQPWQPPLENPGWCNGCADFRLHRAEGYCGECRLEQRQEGGSGKGHWYAAPL